MTTDPLPPSSYPPKRRWLLLRNVWRIVGEVLTPTVFFVVGIDLISILMHLMSSPYDIDLKTIVAISVGANITSKAVIVMNFLPFARSLDRKPLIQPILLRGVCYYVAIVILRLAEHVLISLRSTGGAFGGLFAHAVWNREAAVQIWLFVLCLLYAFCGQINRNFGRGLLREVFAS